MEVDPTRMCELVVGLPAVRVFGIVDEVGGPLLIHVETRGRRPVCGGCGGVVTIKDREKFKEAIRTKLVLEVAGRTPERPLVPVADKEPRVSCLIGEKIWQDRWGR